MNKEKYSVLRILKYKDKYIIALNDRRILGAKYEYYDEVDKFFINEKTAKEIKELLEKGSEDNE